MNYKKLITMSIAGLVIASSCNNQQTNNNENIITKQEIKVVDGQFTPEIMHMLGKVSDPQLSPTNDKVLYGVTYTSIEENKGNRELYVINTDGSGNTKITSTPKSEANARWYNNGANILFLRGGQIYSAQFNGTTLVGEKQISNFDGGIDAFELSPDQKMIMYIKNVKADIKPTDVYPDLKKSTGKVYTDLMYRHWDHFVEEIPHTFIAQFNGTSIGEGTDILGKGEELYELPTLPFGGLEQLSWSPNGEYIAYSCRKVSGKEYAYSTNTDIYLYNIQTKATENLTKGMMGYDTDPLFSPDGKYVAFISMERNGYEADKKRLFIVNVKTGERKELTTDYKYNVESIVWGPNSQNIYFTSIVNALSALFEVDINKTDTKKIADNDATGPIPDNYNYGEGIRRITNQSQIFDFDGVTPIADAQGNVISLLGTNKNMLRPAEIITTNPQTGEFTQLTFENQDILAQLNTPTITQRWLKTVDGKNLHVWVVYPPKFDSTKTYPAVMMCLGGPQGTISQSFSTRWNYRLMASNDYVVVLPNRRGTTAFGQPWCEQISGDYCGLNMQDYLTAARTIKSEPYVNKIAATGASYGGYSIFYLAGIHKNLFDAFVAHAGIFNQEHMYMTTEELWFPHFDNGGAPWDNNPVAKRHYENSPHKLVKNWNTPILVTHGELDYRVPVDQGYAAYNAAQIMGVDSKLILYPEENHWIIRPQNSIHWNREFYNWLDKYCKN